MKSKKFWSYEVSNQFNLTEEILSSAKQRGRFYEDTLIFYDIIGTGIHPSLKNFQGKVPTSINFNNILVDINTLKIIFHAFPNSKVTALKFNNNNFNLKTLECLVKFYMEKEHNINDFSYEWNSDIIIDDIKYSYKDVSLIEDEKLLQDLERSKNFLVNLATHLPSKLEILSLRGDFLGDKSVIKIFEGMKKQENFIRALNLFKNDLTDECIKTFSEMILTNRNLEEINFGNNNLTDNALKLIIKNYGSIPLNDEKLDEYKRLEKERHEIIKQNAKLKAAKKPELEVPFLDELKEKDGEYFLVKNDILRVFNLIQNKFSDKSFENIKKILDGNKKAFITIEGKIFNQEQKEVLKSLSPGQRYGERVFLLK